MELNDCQSEYLKTRDQMYLDEFYKTALPYARGVAGHLCRNLHCTLDITELAHVAVTNIITRYLKDSRFEIKTSINGYISRAVKNEVLLSFRKKTFSEIDNMYVKPDQDDDTLVRNIIRRDINSKIKEIVGRHTESAEAAQRIEDNLKYCLKKGVNLSYRLYRFKGQENAEMRERFRAVIRELKEHLEKYV